MGAPTCRKSCLSPVGVSRAAQGGVWAGEVLSWGWGSQGAQGCVLATAGKRLPREPSTSVSSLSAPSAEQRAQQQKKCKMHLKIPFHFPFRQKQKCLNNRGQKQLLQNFQELGKIKSPLRRIWFRRFPPSSCPVWGTPKQAELLPLKQTAAPGCSIPNPSGPWDICPLASLKASFQKGMKQFPHPPISTFLLQIAWLKGSMECENQRNKD